MEPINIAIIGAVGVGKSTFIQHLRRQPKPSASNITALRHELDDVAAEFAAFEKSDLAKLNDALKAKNAEPITVPAGAPMPTAQISGRAENKHHVELPFERD